MVLLGKEELKRRSSFAFLYWVLIWFAPISRIDTLLGVTSFYGCFHDRLVFLNRSQLPVCFIANRSKTFFSRLRFVYFQSAAEYTIPHAPKPGLCVCFLAPSPSSMSPYLLAGCIYRKTLQTLSWKVHVILNANFSMTKESAVLFDKNFIFYRLSIPWQNQPTCISPLYINDRCDSPYAKYSFSASHPSTTCILKMHWFVVKFWKSFLFPPQIWVYFSIRF